MSEEKLNQKQMTAAQLLAIGNKEKSAIADELNISRTTLWKWEKDNEFFKAEVDRIKHEQEIFGTTLFRNALIDAVNNIRHLANNSTNDKVKLDANKEIIDRIYGKASSKMTLTTEVDNLNSIDKDILDAEFEEWEVEQKEEE